MLGCVTTHDLLTEYNPDPISVMFDPDLLPKVDRFQMVWYDKTYIKQEGVSRMFDNCQIRFSWDINGKFCPSSTMIVVTL